MLKTRLSVTALDQMIWFHRIEDMTTQELRDRLLGLSPPNDKMKIGIAWHKALETSSLLGEIIIDGITFSVDTDAEVEMPQIMEMRGTKFYQIDDVLVTLSGRCDGISGTTLIDHKLTFNPSVESYFESFQWRAYLDIFHGDKFTYYIYHAKQDKEGVVRIIDVQEISFYRYPDMIKDVESGIRDLLGFIKNHVPEKLEVADV